MFIERFSDEDYLHLVVTTKPEYLSFWFPEDKDSLDILMGFVSLDLQGYTYEPDEFLMLHGVPYAIVGNNDDEPNKEDCTRCFLLARSYMSYSEDSDKYQYNDILEMAKNDIKVVPRRYDETLKIVR